MRLLNLSRALGTLGLVEHGVNRCVLISVTYRVNVSTAVTRMRAVRSISPPRAVAVVGSSNLAADRTCPRMRGACLSPDIGMRFKGGMSTNGTRTYMIIAHGYPGAR